MQSEAENGRSGSQVPPRPAHFASPDFVEEKAELEWVLAHPEISRSANLVRFLTYICDRYFQGAASEIREQSIATEALGRKRAGFDSHADPIVRVTARTLRKKLEAIYSTDGLAHRLHIALPVGHYVPEFHRAASPPPAPVQTQGLAAALEPEPVQPVAAPSAQRQWPRIVRYSVLGLAVAAIFLAGYWIGRRQDRSDRPSRVGFKWDEPVWADEFDGPQGQLPSPARWNFDLEQPDDKNARDRSVFCSPRGGGPRECDPHRPNAFLDGSGHLVLRVEKNPSGVWTLVRMTTQGVKDFQYGRIEARMKMPVGAGLWPSFLMVGSNKPQVGWPASGSIDVAENVALTASSNGLGPTMIRSTLHGPRYFGSNGLWHDFRLPTGERIDDPGFHTYGIIWSPGLIQFYVDDPANVYFVHDASDIPEGGTWVFDHPFYIELALAVGGDWAGNSDARTPNPADLLIDWVRVYRMPPVHAPAIAFQPVSLKAGAASASIVTLHAPEYAGRVRLSCATDSTTVPCSLATSVLNFSDTLSQQDTLTLSTNSFTERGRVVAQPGKYHVTITASSVSGDHSQLTVPFEVAAQE